MSTDTQTDDKQADKKHKESFRASRDIPGVSLNWWPNSWDDGDKEGSYGNMFSVKLDEDVWYEVTDIWLDYRHAKRGKLTTELAAALLVAANRLRGAVERLALDGKVKMAEVQRAAERRAS